MKKEKMKPVMSASELITEDARKEIVSLILENKGREIFFMGLLNADGIVNFVEALAFGNAKAVPVVSANLPNECIVIHNHPSGVIEPSEADIIAAGELANMGIGSYITDNRCEKIHIIVKPIKKQEVKFLDKEKLVSILDVNGSLMKNMPDYELRNEQIEMLKACVSSFNNNLISVIEAGTGVGKSLAYLIPAIYWSVENNMRVIVSTNTINLQEQLLYKDIPLLQKILPVEFSACLMKGRSNYLCLRKLNIIKSDKHARIDEKHEEAARAIIDWSRNTTDGSKTDLSFSPAEEVWELFSAEAEACPRIKCPNFEKCFYYKSRRDASKTNLVITNHHLVMADLACRLENKNYMSFAVLPPSKHIIFDEAHNLEDVGTSYFSSQITKLGLERILSRLFSKKTERLGLLFIIDDKINSLVTKNNHPALKEMQDILFEKIFPYCEGLYTLIGEQFTSMLYSFSEFMNFDETGNEGDSLKTIISPEIAGSTFFIDDIQERLLTINKEILKFITSIGEFSKLMKNIPDDIYNDIWSISVDLKGFVLKLELIMNKILSFLQGGTGVCRWFEYQPQKKGRDPFLKFCYGPIYIDKSMKDAVFDVNQSLILTSATMTVNSNFSYVKKQLGLTEYKLWDGAENTLTKEKKNADSAEKSIKPPDKFLHELKLESPFDYEKNVLLGIPFDISEPGSKEFADKIGGIILKSVEYSGGGAMILFTSYYLMKNVFTNIKNDITEMGLKCFIQGETHRHTLLQKFKKHINSVLFATASFWEGVDVKGDSLRLLVLTRLPFRVPTEPILLARADEIRKREGDPFIEMDLPAAVIKFRQGFGRLIRSKTDRGAVLILDKRAVTKNYGKSFINSLPKTSVIASETSEVLDALHEFFG